jgi:hypothetical protein
MVQTRKTFGGKVYRLVHTKIASKSEAKEAIKRLRNDGYLARIVKRLTAPKDRPGWNTHYDIYARAK